MITARTLLAAAASLAFVASPALAALATGTRAPLFTATGAVAGKTVKVDLARELKRGPVVLYFFPAAFTAGCNIEAQAFAEAIPRFRKAGATVIGMTGGNVSQLVDFSQEKCAGAFAVGAASESVVDAYDVALVGKKGWSGRTTYVIGRDGHIAASFSDIAPAEHVARALAAVEALPRGR